MATELTPQQSAQMQSQIASIESGIANVRSGIQSYAQQQGTTGGTTGGGGYTPQQVAQINAQREARVASGLDPYTGLPNKGTLSTTSPFNIGAIDFGALGALGIDLSQLSSGVPGDFASAVSDIISKAGAITFKNEEQKKQWEEIQKLVGEQFQSTLQTKTAMIAQRPRMNMTEEVQQLQEQYGIPQSWNALQGLIPDIANLQTKLAALEAREQQGLLALEGQPIALPAITGEQAQFRKLIAVERAGVSAELGAKAAIAEMHQGNITMARALISDAVQALTYDYNQKLADWEMFYDLYGEFVDTLDNRTQGALDKAYDSLIHQRDVAENEYYQKLEWYVKATSEGTGEPYSFGQIKTISLEDAASRYVEKMRAGGVVEGKWDTLVNQLIKSVYDPSTDTLDIDALNSTLEGYSQEDKTAIKNAVFEKIYELENIKLPLPEYKEVGTTGGTTQIQDPFVQWLMGESPMPTGGVDLNKLTVSSMGGKILPTTTTPSSNLRLP